MCARAFRTMSAWPSGPRTARELRHGDVRVRYVVQHVGGDHDVEGRVVERQALRVGDHDVCEDACLGGHAEREVHADVVRRGCDLAELREIETGTAADVERTCPGGPLDLSEDPGMNRNRIALVPVDVPACEQRP